MHVTRARCGPIAYLLAWLLPFPKLSGRVVTTVRSACVASTVGSAKGAVARERRQRLNGRAGAPARRDLHANMGAAPRTPDGRTPWQLLGRWRGNALVSEAVASDSRALGQLQCDCQQCMGQQCQLLRPSTRAWTESSAGTVNQCIGLSAPGGGSKANDGRGAPLLLANCAVCCSTRAMAKAASAAVVASAAVPPACSCWRRARAVTTAAGAGGRRLSSKLVGGTRRDLFS